MSKAAWVNEYNVALLTDFYELLMAQCYFENKMNGEAVFDLFVRSLPHNWSYLLACGLEGVLTFLEEFSFPPKSLDFLASLKQFTPAFLEYLATLRFTGDVYASPEGTPIFASEPLLEIVAPLPQAQLVETFLLNQMMFQTLIASKASRLVTAAYGRKIIDFALRRTYGADAGLKLARAFFIAGGDGTSNMLAAKIYGIPLTGTMAHSFVQAHEDELDAFREYAVSFPEGYLLVDTFDTVAAVYKVVQLARELGDRFYIQGVRIDSGDLLELSLRVRQILDGAGLPNVKIFASGGLDEEAIAALINQGAPINSFGVGAQLAVPGDAPSIDAAYKLVSYAGKGRMKLSLGKTSLPMRKQIFRHFRDNKAIFDTIALESETLSGQPLLQQVMKQGQRTKSPLSPAQIRLYAEKAKDELPEFLTLSIKQAAGAAYPVRISSGLEASRRDIISELRSSVWREG